MLNSIRDRRLNPNQRVWFNREILEEHPELSQRYNYKVEISEIYREDRNSKYVKRFTI
jgi:hypothetical protein